MNTKLFAAILVGICSLAGCGGESTTSGQAPQGSMFLATTVTVSGATFPGVRNNYVITKTASGYAIKDATGADGTTNITSGQQLKFADVTVNLGIVAKSQSISAADLKLLIELYIAFFNRVPDADGLSYWIDQYKAGVALNKIADSFYEAAIQYTSLTGYSATMSDADFVKLIYKNVLGRSGATAPPEGDIQYWAGNLARGSETKGSLITAMLSSAHAYMNDVTWGWVAQLLNNKYSVGNYFAVQQGLGYNTPEDSIIKGMAISAAITPTSTAAALKLINITDTTSNWAPSPSLGLANFKSCPISSLIQTNEFYQCMIGTMNGVTSFGAAPCTFTVASNGRLTLLSGSTTVGVDYPYPRSVPSQYLKSIVTNSDTFLMLILTGQGAVSFKINVTSPAWAALGVGSAGVEVNAGSLSCKFSF